MYTLGRGCVGVGFLERVKSITLKVLPALMSFSKEICTSNTLKRFFLIKCFNSSLKKFGLRIGLETLPKAQWTQGIKKFDSFNTFSSKKKLQKALESSNFSLLFWQRAKSTYVEL